MVKSFFEARRNGLGSVVYSLYIRTQQANQGVLCMLIASYMILLPTHLANVFQYNKQIFFWQILVRITGHSYIVYGPLAAGATSLMFEGIQLGLMLVGFGI